MIAIFFDNPEIAAYLSSRPAIFEVVLWLCLALGALIVFCLVYLGISRALFLNYQRRKLKASVKWNPVLRNPQLSTTPIPPLGRHWERVLLLKFWLAMRTNADKELATRLDEFALRVRLDTTICRILTPTTFNFLGTQVWLQIIAIDATQWIQTPGTLKFVEQLLDSNDRYLAVNACAGLARIKAEGYERAIIKTLMRFPEEAPYITSHLGAAGGSDILHVLAPFLNKLPRYAVTNFIDLAEQSKDKSLLPIVEERLQTSRNNEEIAALIRSIGNLGSEEQRNLVIPYLQSNEDFLQIQAAKALGRIGLKEDIELLKPLLSGKNWWLRYRAAEAIILLSGKDEEFIRELALHTEDKFAADILRHAWSEQEWHLI